jgi:hypothetical protein
MRRWALVFGGAAALLTSATPADAAVGDPGPDIGISVTPVAGPPGTAVTVRGQCRSPGDGSASFGENPRGSDAILMYQGATFATDSTGRFSVKLAVPDARPQDLLLRAGCPTSQGSFASETQPFAVTDRVTNGAPDVFTGLGHQPCGRYFWTGTPVPCEAHVKAFALNGDTSTRTNFFVPQWSWGVSVAVGNVGGSLKIAVGNGPGQQAQARVLDERGAPMFDRAVFGNFTGGVNVAMGDVDGDGSDDLIVAAGAGGGPHVRVFRVRDQAELSSFFAYDPAFAGGVYVTAADLDGDGDDEIVTGTGPGGGPHVRAFEGNGTARNTEFFAYNAAFRGGVSVAATDLDHDGRAEIITGAGPGGGPHVGVFTAAGQPLWGLYAYDPAYRGGVYVAGGSGRIATGTVDGGPHVKVIDRNGTTISSFHAYDTYSSGVRPALRP